uniref:Uncharacterized protein n=1 Tax=Angiostrongylus cantonensis TaxID=6313 RepID=A0A0K0D6L3_ANGCA
MAIVMSCESMNAGLRCSLDSHIFAGLEGPLERSGEPGDCGDYGPLGNSERRGSPGDGVGYCQYPSRDGVN